MASRGLGRHLEGIAARRHQSEQLRDWLAASDVELCAVESESTATAHLAADGSATYDFDIDWSLPAGLAVTDAAILHTGSIAGFLRPGAEVVRRLIQDVRSTALVTFDPNVRPALIDDRVEARRRIEQLVALADVVKASDEDLEWLYPGQDPVQCAATWQASGPALVVLTLGGEGATGITAAGIIRVPGQPAQVVDTVGAGDTFMGALIHGLAHAGYAGSDTRDLLRVIPFESLERILVLAATAAAITVSRPGADPPRLAELPEH
ncbi:PfkB family carbohydrate kinase [Microbacterium aurum]